MDRRLWVAGLALALGAGTAHAQSLGEAARRERERRTAKTEAVKHYTDADLKGYAGERPAPGTDAPAETAVPPDANVRAGRLPDPLQVSEAYWRRRAAEARGDVALAERRLEHLQQKSAFRGPFLPGQTPSCKSQRQLDRARDELVRARRALEDLDEEARRAGAFPGWLR